MNTIVALNVIVIAVLGLFFVREERLHRRFSRKIVETKSDLITIIHQLRSPLSNLRKYNAFLQSNEFGTLSLAQQEAINKVQTSLGESLVVLDRLLARSRLEDESITVQPGSVRVRDIVQGALDALASPAKDKNHTIVIDGQRGIEVVTDALLLHGILDEILSNAIRYTPIGGTITITVSETGTAVEIRIRDTGIGISEEERPHIFEKFFRGERAKTLSAGNGLGLAFSKLFTAELGGTVRFTSKLNSGSVFILTLPRNRRR